MCVAAGVMQCLVPTGVSAGLCACAYRCCVQLQVSVCVAAGVMQCLVPTGVSAGLCVCAYRCVCGRTDSAGREAGAGGTVLQCREMHAAG